MTAVQKLIIKLGHEVRNIIKSALEISYYSRGGWSYSEVLAMPQGVRELAVEFINERLKIASKSMFPVY